MNPTSRMKPAAMAREPGSDRVGAETGADGAFLDDGQWSRQGAGAQQHGKIVGVLDGEVAADLALATDDRLANDGRADHLAVEHDGERLTDMARADIGEAFGADAIEPEVDDPFPGARVLPGVGLGQIRAVDLDVPSNGNALCLMPPFGVGQQLRLGVGSRSFRCYEAERHLGRRAEQSLDAIGV